MTMINTVTPPLRRQGALRGLLALLLGLTALAQSPAAVGQTITNPGYETGNLSGWGTGGTPSASTAAAHTGTYGGLNPGGWNSITQNITVTAGTTYTVKAWARLVTSVAGNNQAIFVSPDNGTTKTYAWVTSTAWTQLSLNITATGSHIQIGSVEVNGNAVNADVDDWTISVAGSPPPVPTGVTATAGNTQVTLSWSASTGATAYDVKRSTVSGSGYATVSSPTTTSYTNTGLTNGTTYYFVVDAKNASGTSANSSQVSATPAGGTNLVLNPGFETGSLTSWPSVGGTYGVTTTSPHTGTYCGYEGGSWSSVAQTVSGLTANTAYTVTVWAKLSATTANSIDVFVTNFGGTKVSKLVTAASWTQLTMSFTTGAGSTSAQIGWEDLNGSTVTCYTDDWTLTGGGGGGGAPPVPTGLAATAGNAQVALTWNASTGATAYDVKRSTVSGSGYVTVSSPTTTSYTNTGLTNGVTYYYVVDAKNASGTSANSNQVAAIPTPPAQSQYTLGVSIGAPLDYEQDITFADATKVARGITSTNGVYDANGWPTGDGNIGFWYGNSSAPSKGTWKLQFDGQATLTIGTGTATIANKVYNSSTDTTSADVTFATDQTDFVLNFTGTTHGIRNVKFMRPIAYGSATAHNTTELWYRPLTDLLSRFKWIRFMDFTATNGNAQSTWASRTLPARWSQQNYLSPNPDGWQGHGAAWEYAINLCNATNKDLWINVPTNANLDYLTKLAQLIKYGSDGVTPYTSTQANPVWAPLNANLNVYVEYSNEIWNFGFAQFGQVKALATAEVNAGGSPLNFDGSTSDTDWTIRYWAREVKNISDAFRAIFGDGAMNTRIRPLFETQQSWSDQWLSHGLWFLDTYYNNADGVSHVATPHPVSYYCWGGGGSTYIMDAISSTYLNSDTLTVDQLFTSAFPQAYAQFDTWIQRDVDYLRAFGIKRISYEGGSGIDGNGHSDAVKNASQGDTRITQVYQDLVNHYYQDGGEYYAQFLGSNIAHGIYQTDYTANLNTPKRQAVDLLNGATPPAPTWGALLPATINGNGYRVSSDLYSTGANNGPLSMSKPNWFGYTVRNTAATTYTVKVNAGSVNGNGRLNLWVDGTLAGTFTIPNTGSTTVYADSTGISVTLQPGQHGIRLAVSADSFTVNQLKIQ